MLSPRSDDVTVKITSLLGSENTLQWFVFYVWYNDPEWGCCQVYCVGWAKWSPTRSEAALVPNISVGAAPREGLTALIVGSLSGLPTGFHWELCIYSVILLVCFKNVANLWIASHLCMYIYVQVNFRAFWRNFFLASLAQLRYRLLDLSVRKGVNFKACLKQKNEATILPGKPVASRESSAPRAPSGLELLALEEVEIPVTPQKKDQALVPLRLNRGLYGVAPSEVRAGVWLIRMSYFSPHVCFSLTSGSWKAPSTNTEALMDGRSRGQIPLCFLHHFNWNTKRSGDQNSQRQSVRNKSVTEMLLPLGTNHLKV